MYSIILIVTLIVISGIIAYIGDLTGFRIGKKKISIFGWRPHRTAVFVTITTGVIISILTISILAFLSNDVRTALFGLDELRERQYYLSREIQVRNDMLESTRAELRQQTAQLEELESEYEQLSNQIEQKSNQLEALLQSREKLNAEKGRLQEEISELQDTVKGLYSGINWLRRGDIIFDQGEQIAMTLVDGSKPEVEIRQEMLTFLNQASIKALEMGAERDENSGQVLIISKNEYEELMTKILESQTEMVVRLVASMNAIKGETVIVDFSVMENKLVFRENETVLVEEIPPISDPEEAESRVFSILRKVNVKAVQNGIIPDPGTSFVGTISAVNLFEIIQRIVSCNANMEIRVISLYETWSTGPFKVEIEAEKMVH